ncbi:hypothetical protein ACO2Q9_12485 [Variovorax sp. VNK109]|uniref:hypothetical protein n=1 Tax=Variovorax sp. VNK109 TaxID=3400919 RepID=UPI003C087B2C
MNSQPHDPATQDAGTGWQIVHVHPDAPPKPVFGAPCNGCGLCCLSEPCPVGIVVSRRRRGACDALRWREAESRYVCGMVADPADVLGAHWRWAAPLIRRMARRWIAAGSGCDAHLESGRYPSPEE